MNTGSARCHGIRYQLRYEQERANVLVEPNEFDLAHADDSHVAGFWQEIADWCVRFWAANPCWKIDNRKCPDVTPIL